MKKGKYQVSEIPMVNQLVEYLQIDKHTIYRLAKSGKIPSTEIRVEWSFKKNLIDNGLRKINK